MRRTAASLLLLTLAASVSARPADPIRNGYLFEIPASNETRYVPDTFKAGLLSPSGACVTPDTIAYGGTYWAADSLRWEALRDSVWTFDTGVGSAYGPTGPNKPAGYHTRMEGWFGLDQTLNPSPYFRRSGTCRIDGSFSLWAGVTTTEANALCYAAGEGYGNGWHMIVEKTFAYGGSGTATLAYNYTHELEANFDFAYVEIEVASNATTIELANYTGNGSGSESITLTTAMLNAPNPGNVTIRIVMDSDGSYSDEDGLNPTTCGAFVIDNISLTGAIADFTDFEAGMNGWLQVIPTTNVGDYSNLARMGTDLPPPVTFCRCGVRDSVLVFYDELDGHPLDQDNIAVSPWIDLKRGGDAGRPGKLMLYNVYAEMPFDNRIFVTIRARYYPYVCPSSGQITTSPFLDQNVIFYFGEAPFCTPEGLTQLRDYSGVIGQGAEQVQVAWGVVNGCSWPIFTPCTGASNTTPWIDNVRLGVYGIGEAPNLSVLTFDFFQDNFAADGTLRPNSAGRVDANTIKNGSTPAPGMVLRDTLNARGDGGNTETRLVFKVRPGPFTSGAALTAWQAKWTPEPGLGAGWYSARMDTAEQGGIKGNPASWMSCFHEADPGFSGNDRSPDPLDPSQNANEILPDHVLTPGSRVDYFIAARYLPGDPRNPGNACQWFVVPDTTGGRYQEVEILPSSMGADSSWNCTLYVDHHDDRSLFDQLLEEQGLAASLGAGSNNAEGTRYDRFDNETPSSAQLSFGRPLRSKHGASIIQTFAYKNIVWHSASLSAVQLTDEDANVIGPWLTLRGIGNNRFWGSGSGLATSMNGSGEPTTVNFMLSILGVIRQCNTIRDVNCPNPSVLDSTFCIPTSAVAGSHFTTTTATSARGNGCPDLESFDVLSANGAVATSRGQLNYVKNAANVAYASVTNHNTIDVDYKTVLDGFAVGRARTTPANPHIQSLCTVTGASITRTDNVLDWFASATSCRIPLNLQDVPLIDPPKPPAFRTALGSAWPNPMNPTTRIQFTNGTENGRVVLQIFDVTGRLVRRLVDGKMTAGVHEVTWDGSLDNASAAPSGMYFYRMTADGGSFSAAKKIVMMK
jgi:hypothetical protein